MYKPTFITLLIIIIINSIILPYTGDIKESFTITGSAGFYFTLDEKGIDLTNSLVNPDGSILTALNNVTEILGIINTGKDDLTGSVRISIRPYTALASSGIGYLRWDDSYSLRIDYINFNTPLFTARGARAPFTPDFSNYTIHSRFQEGTHFSTTFKPFPLSLYFNDLLLNTDKHTTGNYSFLNLSKIKLGLKYILNNNEINSFLAYGSRIESGIASETRHTIELKIDKLSFMPGIFNGNYVYGLAVTDLDSKGVKLLSSDNSPAITQTLNAYRLFSLYKYPVQLKDMSFIPKCEIKFQENIDTVISGGIKTINNKSYKFIGESYIYDKSNWDYPDAKYIGIGCDLSLKNKVISFNTENIFKINFLKKDNNSSDIITYDIYLKPVLSINFDQKSYLYLDTTFDISDILNHSSSKISLKITPYMKLVSDTFMLEGQFWYFDRSDIEKGKNNLAFQSILTYNFYKYFYAGFELGTEKYDSSGVVISSAYDSAKNTVPVHWYLFFRGLFNF